MQLPDRLPAWIAVLIVGFVGGVAIWLVTLAARATTNKLTVSFLDVGQGDSILIETPTGVQVLIDGGPPGSLATQLSGQLMFYDRFLNTVIATHADGDHIGGLPRLFANFRVGQVYSPVYANSTGVFYTFRQSVSRERAGQPPNFLSAGEVLGLGSGAYLVVFYPTRLYRPTGTNSSSLVAKLIYGDTSVLFVSDIPAEVERYLAGRYGKLLNADVLKVSHHGSKHSSTAAFLSVVSPKLAVIQAGKDNPYGHPAPETLRRLKTVGSEVICTCKSGTITLVTDGNGFRRRQ